MVVGERVPSPGAQLMVIVPSNGRRHAPLVSTTSGEFSVSPMGSCANALEAVNTKFNPTKIASRAAGYIFFMVIVVVLYGIWKLETTRSKSLRYREFPGTAAI